MKSIKSIEFKQLESYPLEYSFKYTLASENRKDLITNVYGKFNNELEETKILKNMTNWRSHFESWDWHVDEKISEDIGGIIYDLHLITKDNKKISLFEVPRFFLNLDDII